MTGLRRSAAPSVGIPPQFRAALSALAELDSKRVQDLLSGLAAAGFFKSIVELEELMSAEFGEGAPDAVAALLSLAGMARSIEPGVIAAGASQASNLPVEDGLRNQLRENLQALLESPEIYSTAAAVDLLTQHATNYRGSRIVTDIRPIFSRDVGEPPTGVVISETLELQTWDRDGANKTLHIAMDDADLRELRDTVERALAKSETLRRTLNQQHISVFNLDEREK